MQKEAAYALFPLLSFTTNSTCVALTGMTLKSLDDGKESHFSNRRQRIFDDVSENGYGRESYQN